MCRVAGGGRERNPFYQLIQFPNVHTDVGWAVSQLILVTLLSGKDPSTEPSSAGFSKNIVSDLNLAQRRHDLIWRNYRTATVASYVTMPCHTLFLIVSYWKGHLGEQLRCFLDADVPY